MSEATLAEQTEDLRKAGVTVRRGAVAIKGEERLTIPQIGSAHWLLIWAKNAFQNAPLVRQATGVRFLAESCTGLPAFVVGVGPSLDADISTLKQAQGHGVIIATDAAFRPLMAKGIRPDLVISYDCKAEQGLLWEGVPAHDVPCLFDSCASPAAIASWQGPVLFYNHWHQADEFSRVILPAVFPAIGQLPSGATVGNMAYFLSKFLGCSVAVTVGYDFCYEPTGIVIDPATSTPAMVPCRWRYRAQDYKWIPGDEAGMPARWDPCQVKLLYNDDERVARSFMRSMGGQEYRTDPELECYFETFNQFKQNFKIETVNCAAGGMLAQSCETVPLAAAIERYCKKELQPGRTILPHLARVVRDPRKAPDACPF